MMKKKVTVSQQTSPSVFFKTALYLDTFIGLHVVVRGSAETCIIYPLSPGGFMLQNYTVITTMHQCCQPCPDITISCVVSSMHGCVLFHKIVSHVNMKSSPPVMVLKMPSFVINTHADLLWIHALSHSNLLIQDRTPFFSPQFCQSKNVT